MDSFLVVGVATALVALAATIVFFFSQQGKKTTQEEPPKEEPQNKTKKKEQKRPVQKKKSIEAHPREICALKHHTDSVLDICWSPNGEILASTSADRSVRAWLVEYFHVKDHKNTKVNIPFDHGTNISFSHDSQSLFLTLDQAKEIAIIKMGKHCTIEEKIPVHHKDIQILSLSVGVQDRCILTCGNGEELIFSNRKGKIIEKIATKQFHNYMATISQDGQYAMAATFSSDVKIFKIADKSGKIEIKKLMALLGHKGAVLSCDFTRDSKSAVTCSKDHTWKLWKLDVEYQGIANPECLLTVPHPEKDKKVFDIIRASPNSTKLAAVTNNNNSPTLFIFSLKNGQLLEQIDNIHKQKITQVVWSPDSGMIATSSGDKQVKVWRAD